jgi:cytochrome P450
MDAIVTAEREKPPIDFDPLSPEYLADPYPFLAAAAAAAPAFYCESIDHWVVTRYHDIRQIFRTPALFSAANANSPLRPPCPMAAKALQEGGFKSIPTLANVDPPAHTRVRKIANVAFTPKRVAEMESFVRKLSVAANDCATGMLT